MTSVKSRVNRGIAVVLVLLTLAVTAQSGSESVDALRSGAALSSWVVWFSVVVLWLPEMQVDSTRIVVRNPLRSFIIPFGQIIQLDARYSLRIRTANQSIPVWVGPAPGVITSTLVRLDPTYRRGRTETSVPISQAAGTESGNAFELVNRPWRRLVEDGSLDTSQAIVSHWNSGALWFLLVPVAVTVAAGVL